jgi:hypothetical protein
MGKLNRSEASLLDERMRDVAHCTAGPSPHYSIGHVFY